MKPFHFIPALAAFLLVCIQSNAQNQDCWGLKNPTSFDIGAGGTASAQWYGYTGTKNGVASQCNALGASFPTTPINASQLTSLQSSCSPLQSFDINGNPDGTKRFSFKGQGNDPYTANALPYLPPDTSFHSSIRLGNACLGAEAEMLEYQFNVNPNNQLVIIWFAMVVENSPHGAAENPEFVIMVEKQNPTNGSWGPTPMGDTLCYIEPAPPNGQLIPPFTSGGQSYYRTWNKVMINLNRLLYQRVRIKIAMSDCSQSGHWGYCYFVGDCQKMELIANGCAAGESDSVARINAPEGAQDYKWYRSKTGPLFNQDQTNINNYELIPGANQHSLGATLNQFRHTTTGDTLTQNTFLCRMTSYMDPDYPVVSNLYATTGNTKPTLVVDSVHFCDASITLYDKSKTFYQANDNDWPDTSKTVWKFYSGLIPSPQTLVATEIGPHAHHQYNTQSSTTGNFCATVRVQNYDSTCWNEKTVQFRTIKSPKPEVIVDDSTLCKGDTIILQDRTARGQSTYHRWQFGNDSTITFEGTNGRQTFAEYTFDHTTDVTLRTRGTEYFMELLPDGNGEVSSQRVYCYSDTTFRIFVSPYPGPKIVGDTIVCNGNNSDLRVSDTVENCRYDWFHVAGGTSPFLENSNTLQIPISQDKTYFVKATTPDPFECVSWDSVDIYLVKPDLKANRTRICTDSTVVLTAGRAAYFEWTSNPEDPDLAAQSTEPEITVSPKETTVYTVVGHGTNGCSATPLSQKIEVFPFPIMGVRLTPDYIDSENPSVQFADVSQYGTSSLWDFGNGETSTFRTVVHTFSDLSEDSLQIHLTTANALGCWRDTSFWVPVGIFAVWFPNAITPKLETNNVFKAFTANDLLDFELYIYDRNGAQVFYSNNVEEGWNGTYHGFDCKEGVYVYIAKYRRKGVDRLMSQKGTVTLIR